MGLSEFMSSFEAANIVQIFQRGDKTANDLLGSTDKLLERLPLISCKASKPHTRSSMSADYLWNNFKWIHTVFVLHGSS